MKESLFSNQSCGGEVSPAVDDELGDGVLLLLGRDTVEDYWAEFQFN